MNRLYLLLGLLFLSACTLSQQTPLPLPQALRPPLDSSARTDIAASTQTESPLPLLVGDLPVPPGQSDFILQPPALSDLPKFAPSQPMQINLADIPLPAFINEIFGNLLGLSFQIAPTLQNKKDLVTLRFAEAMPAAEIYRLARQVLRTYGVGIVQEGGLLNFVAQADAGADREEVPLLTSGRTLPEVPESHRTVFHVIPLVALNQMQVSRMLSQIYQQPGLAIREDSVNNSLLISGPPALVRQAVQAVRMLDQPFMQGRHTLRLQPAFLNAGKLAEQLLNVLKIEGYHVNVGVSSATPAILLLPVTEINSVFVFARDQQVLAHVRQWAETLDIPGHLTDQGGLFFYPVQNTPAQTLVDTLQPLLSNISAAPAAAPGTSPIVARGNYLAADKIRNMLLFQGSAEDWARLLPMIQALDQAAKLILIEVTIAEVLLSNEERFGIEWLLHNSVGGGHTQELGTLGGLGLGGSGFNYSLLNGLGQVRAILNAFAGNSRINVLSSPRLMVKSGETASITVGSEVPIVTSQSVASDGAQSEGNSAIMQAIQYRKTGINLNVTAVAHAGNRVDLEITQEISQAEPNTVSDISSPVILNRSINTVINLSDGGSVLLGGLISDSRTQGSSGVPGLSKIPLLGSLFRVDRQNYERSELIVLIVPYVLNNADEAQAITDAFRQRLSWEETAPLDQAE
jgi:general secretion pathway protein D